jgi:hypothetical protein
LWAVSEKRLRRQGQLSKLCYLDGEASATAISSPGLSNPLAPLLVH